MELHIRIPYICRNVSSIMTKLNWFLFVGMLIGLNTASQAQSTCSSHPTIPLIISGCSSGPPNGTYTLTRVFCSSTDYGYQYDFPDGSVLQLYSQYPSYSWIQYYNNSSGMWELVDYNFYSPWIPDPTTFAANFLPLNRSGTSCTSATYSQCSLSPSVTSQTNPTCAGGTDGTVTIDPGGGSSPYTYSWGGSNSSTAGTTATISGLSAGSYTVTVSDAYCNSTVGVTITDPEPVRVLVRPSSSGNFNISTYGGSDGSIRTLILNAAPPLTYTWRGPGSPSGAYPTGLSSGKYFLHVKDNYGCEGEGGPLFLSEPDPNT